MVHGHSVRNTVNFASCCISAVACGVDLKRLRGLKHGECQAATSKRLPSAGDDGAEAQHPMAVRMRLADVQRNDIDRRQAY